MPERLREVTDAETEWRVDGIRFANMRWDLKSNCDLAAYREFKSWSILEKPVFLIFTYSAFTTIKCLTHRCPVQSSNAEYIILNWLYCHFCYIFAWSDRAPEDKNYISRLLKFIFPKKFHDHDRPSLFYFQSLENIRSFQIQSSDSWITVRFCDGVWSAWKPGIPILWLGTR